MSYDIHLNISTFKLIFKNLDNLNGHLNIGIHSMFEYTSDNEDNYNIILKMFKNNFKFKNDINSVQIINDNNLVKTNTQSINIDIEVPVNKKITKGKFIDVYNVFNINTNNNEGILYIKTIDDSKTLRKMFENKENIGVFFIF